MPDMEQLFNQWVRQFLEAEPENDERERVERPDNNHLAREPEDSSEDNSSDSEHGLGDCDGNHAPGEHCDICASYSDCYCYECFGNPGEELFEYYHRLLWWYFYRFYMEWHEAQVARGTESHHDRDDNL